MHRNTTNRFATGATSAERARTRSAPGSTREVSHHSEAREPVLRAGVERNARRGAQLRRAVGIAAAAHRVTFRGVVEPAAAVGGRPRVVRVPLVGDPLADVGIGVALEPRVIVGDLRDAVIGRDGLLRGERVGGLCQRGSSPARTRNLAFLPAGPVSSPGLAA